MLRFARRRRASRNSPLFFRRREGGTVAPAIRRQVARSTNPLLLFRMRRASRLPADFSRDNPDHIFAIQSRSLATAGPVTEMKRLRHHRFLSFSQIAYA